MNRKLGVIVSLLLAIVFTGLIVHGARQAYEDVARTAEVVVLLRDLPKGTQIQAGDLELKTVPEAIAADWLTAVEQSASKITRIGLLKGQFLSERALRAGYVKELGHVGIVIDVALASSAVVSAGDLVDIHVVIKEEKRDAGWQHDAPEEEEEEEEFTTVVLAHNIRVLRVLTAEGRDVSVVPKKEGALDIGVGGNVRTAAVMLEISEEKATSIVYHALEGEIYLVQSATNLEVRD